MANFKDKILAEYGEDNNNQLAKDIGYLMCSINNENENRYSSSDSLFNIDKISFKLGDSDFTYIVTRLVVIALIVRIFYKTVRPTTIEKGTIPFEQGLPYAMAFPYIENTFRHQILYLFIIILFLGQVFVLNATWNINENIEEKESEKKWIMYTGLIFKYLLIIGIIVYYCIIKDDNSKKFKITIFLFIAIYIILQSVYISLYIEKRSYINYFNIETLILLILFLYFYINRKSNTNHFYEFIIIMLVYNIIVQIILLSSFTKEKNDDLNLKWSNFNDGYIGIFVTVIVLYLSAILFAYKKWYIIASFLTALSTIIIIGSILYINIRIAWDNPISELILLGMYNFIPSGFGEFISDNEPEFMTKFRAGNYPGLYKFLTIAIKKPSEEWTLPFLNWFLIPALLYGYSSGDYAPYFNAKPYKTSL